MITAASATYCCVYEAAKEEAHALPTITPEVIVDEANKKTLLHLLSHKPDSNSMDGHQELIKSVQKVLDCSTL